MVRNPPSDFRAKTSRDIHVGIDAFERIRHLYGVPLCTNYHRPRLGCYTAIEHIDPKLELSVALFAPAWTWETMEGEFDWDAWWAKECTFWVGHGNSKAVRVPLANGIPFNTCHLCFLSRSPFKPLAHFYPRQPPPNPSHLPFFTTFCPGVGKSWFVGGEKVFLTQTGWTDVDKCTSLGDLLWPCPTPAWVDGRSDAVPTVLVSVHMGDAWLGGSCLRLMLYLNDTDKGFSGRLRIPIQTLVLAANEPYTMVLVFKANPHSEVSLSVKPTDETRDMDILALNTVNMWLSGGWTQFSCEIMLISIAKTSEINVDVGVELSLSARSKQMVEAVTLLDLGLLAVHPAQPPKPQPTIVSARFERTADCDLRGLLSWTAIQGPSADFVCGTAPVTAGFHPAKLSPRPGPLYAR